MFVIGSIPCLCNEVEIDDQYDKQIHRPGDDGIEHLPVGIGFVVLPAPASVGDSPHSGIRNRTIDRAMSHVCPTMRQRAANPVSTKAISSIYFRRITDLLFFFIT